MAKKGPVQANILFDKGADRSYITNRMVKLISPEYVSSEAVSYARFGSEKSGKAELRNLYAVKLKGQQVTTQLTAIEVPTLCVPLHRKAIPERAMQQLKFSTLADNYTVRHM